MHGCPKFAAVGCAGLGKSTLTYANLADIVAVLSEARVRAASAVESSCGLLECFPATAGEAVS